MRALRFVRMVDRVPILFEKFSVLDISRKDAKSTKLGSVLAKRSAPIRRNR
jgi:hypothetical protein